MTLDTTRLCKFAIPLALIGAFGIAACSDTPAGSAQFEVVNLDGLVREIEASAGASPSGLMVNLWATWCAPCIAEMPDLHAFAAEAPLPVKTVSIDLAMPVDVDSADGVAEFAAGHAIELPTWLYDGDFGDLIDHFGLETGVVPQTLLFDTHGALVAVHSGTADMEAFAELAATTR